LFHHDEAAGAATGISAATINNSLATPFIEQDSSIQAFLEGSLSIKPVMVLLRRGDFSAF
jgi:hypothetical protein